MIDLLIIGGGIAGMCAALRAPHGASIVVVDKGEAGAGSSPLAQGGMAAAIGPDDSPELHAGDTIAAGAGICDADVVADICAQGPAAVAWLTELGCAFDRTSEGSMHVAREGGQTVARSVHWKDATGAEIVRALRTAVRARNVERITARALVLLMDDGRVVGARTEAGDRLARATLIATGGAGALWEATTNAPGATGDGALLAMGAGAQLADLEFMQFHPTALAAPGRQRVLLTEALRGEGATLIDPAGERFVDELAPRHIVAKAILDAGEAFLDCRGIARLEELFPTVVAGARAHGLDPVTEPLPVGPAAHYFIGGVSTDAHGATSVPGLFAAGECASTGMHGANRMAGNSLLETVVIGARVGARAVDEPIPGPGEPVAEPLEEAPDERLRALMWSGVGPIRSEDGLLGARAALRDARGSHAALCDRIAIAALARHESRGVHIRADHPDPDPGLAMRSFDRGPRAMRD